ncbi:hypothetical protein LYNGBM3L_18080 [Moorena producens 3L]|uniref:Uncharacterized protein n=1 Tax=Moorena producens 3L TaxID=489825 RepID=F4XM17_9CYAN|nr:hypothetical protein LYNGBM3L_18080 [Moorena producens 3L]
MLYLGRLNLAAITLGFMGTAKTASNYKLLQRFFRDFELDYTNPK